MKYILLLLAKALVLLFIVLFFADHAFLPPGTLAKTRNLLLLLLFMGIGYNMVSIYITKQHAPESGLLYKTVSGVRSTAGHFSQYIQPFQKELIVYSLIAAGLAIAGALLAGIPGFLLLEIPVKLGICRQISGDGAWPAALLMSLLWPLCLPAGVFLKHWLNSHGYPLFTFAGPLLAVVTGVPVLVLLVYAVSK